VAGVPDVSEARAWLARLDASLAQRPGVRVKVDATVRLAAVLAMFRVAADDELELLFIKRAEYEGDPWSGHVALPGGRHEPHDTSLEDTAVRETLEELGVDVRAHGRVLGALDDLHPRTPVLPPICVRPYVAVLEDEVPLVPSSEVAAAFWVPLRALLDPETAVEATIVVHGEERVVPSYRFGDYTIWGMTERILSGLLRRLTDRTEARARPRS
jgi:8-oxo-dGTP pyrophosphatase MutT (NUDIX family)